MLCLTTKCMLLFISYVITKNIAKQQDYVRKGRIFFLHHFTLVFNHSRTVNSMYTDLRKSILEKVKDRKKIRVILVSIKLLRISWCVVQPTKYVHTGTQVHLKVCKNHCWELLYLNQQCYTVKYTYLPT